ncbi:MAG: acetyl-CoA synthetase [Acidimicrobiia bacterium]
MTETDPRSPCIIGVARHTWHPKDVGEAGAPEPLDMWEQMARAAADDSGAGASALDALQSVQIVYCQTWQYDDPVARLCERVGASPSHRFYSGIGGTTPQVLVNWAAEAMLKGELDIALVTGAEALATQRAARKRGEKYRCSFPPAERGAYPWEWPPDPIEIAHEASPAWLTFAVFDNARRAHLGESLDDYRRSIGEMMAPMTEIAAASPHAWYPVARSVSEIVEARPENRMVGYPYTKYMVSVMDVDMASALLITTHAKADELGVAPDKRVYLRGWCYANDPVLLAEHDDMWRSPAMAAASGEAMRVAGIAADDVAYLDLYSCFPSSVHFGRDALGMAASDPRPLTVTGGLPYHGGPASNYLGHSIGAMAEGLRDDPGSYGMVSGVGMFMTKHVYGVYSSTPGAVTSPDKGVQDAITAAHPARPVVPEHDGKATVVAYSVVHGREAAEWALLILDIENGNGGARTYAKAMEPELLAAAEERELVGTTVHCAPTTVTLMTGGEGRANLATI